MMIQQASFHRKVQGVQAGQQWAQHMVYLALFGAQEHSAYGSSTLSCLQAALSPSSKTDLP